MECAAKIRLSNETAKKQIKKYARYRKSLSAVSRKASLDMSESSCSGHRRNKLN